MATQHPTPPRAGGERSRSPKSQIGPVTQALRTMRAVDPSVRTTKPEAPEPLRALLVYETLPPGCIAHPITSNRTAPHLKVGEFAVIDTTDRMPVHGELFVIRYRDPIAVCSYRDSVVEVRSRVWSTLDGQQPLWSAVPYVRPRSIDEVNQWLDQGRELVMTDGPYKPGAIEEKLVGRIIGVLAGAFEEPKRLAGGAA